MSPILRVLLRLVFPSVCPLCASDLPMESKDPICISCSRRFPWNPLCEFGGGRALRLIYSAAEFRGPVRDALIRLKYGGRDDLAPWLADRGLDALSIPLTNFDAVVPVPISTWSEGRRGYNQAELLAKTISRSLNRPMLRGWLGSRWWRRSQTKLNRQARRANARRGFFLRRSQRLPFKKILLIDDVKTTAATLERCAVLLRQAGAKRVSAFVVARDPIGH